MPRKMTSLVGDKYGKLTVLSFAGRLGVSRQYKWLCLCDCGNTSVVCATNLRNGQTQTCGCGSSRHTIGLRNFKAGRRTRAVYDHMIQRCYDPNNKRYASYGGRGIYICAEWLSSYDAFVRDMGPAPVGKQIDRIDNNGPYAPHNCRWVTQTENARNKSNNRFLTYNNQRLTIPEWSEITEIPYIVLYKRMWKGWDDARTITTPYRG